MTDNPNPGWYQDTTDATLLRYWDGSAWTGNTHPAEEQTIGQPAPSTASRTRPAILVAGILVLGLGIVAIVMLMLRGDHTSPSTSPEPQRSIPVTTSLPAEDVEQTATFSVSDAALQGPPELGDPTDIELPALDSAAPVWLRSAEIEEFLVAAAPLWADGSQRCQSAVGDLNAVAAPEQLAAMFEDAPDPVLSDIFTGLYRTVVRALLACEDPAEFELRQAELSWQWGLAQHTVDTYGSH